jgi:CheY-like chemotaxis protein/signal transduction histidine kinase
LPVVLCFFQSRQVVPVLIATFASAFSILGFFISPPSEVSQDIALLNRTFAASGIWISAILVRQILGAKALLERQDWVKSRTAQLSAAVRGELTAKEIGESILTFLSEHTGLVVGNLYLRSSPQELTHLAGHASAQTAMDPPVTIAMGEGLVGQCARERKKINLDPAPRDYLSVSSSTGSGSAQAVKLLPLVAGDDLVGVLELGFLRSIDQRSKDFLAQISELLGIALRSAQYKANLADLLAESQQLSEELQAQQEELRVVNEELEQQSRALRDSHTRMENQQAELEQTNQQLEEQAQKMEHQATELAQSYDELRRSKTDLEKKTKELESASRYKSEFMANMSHELRTPLNSSLILARLLADNKDGNLTQEQVKYAEVIHSSGNDLLNLINDILDLSKVESGKLKIEPVKVRLPVVRDTLLQLFRPLATQKGLEFKIELEEGVQEEIVTDPQRLEQILKNLLSNAIKFTEKGSVSLTLRRNGQEVDFLVKDTGVGIRPEEQGVIFEAFRQADGTTNRKFGGTGLGLSISRELAKILGGHITVASTPGQGSTFTLHIPEKFGANSEVLKKADVRETADFHLTPQPSKSDVTFSFKDDRDGLSKGSRRILIIEDDEAFARILFDLAHEMGFSGLVSPTADEGLRLAREFLPEAIVLDVRLPDHSGLIVLDQLKQDPRTRHIPVHVISSSDQSKSAKEMGAVGYAVKPVKIETLKAVFQNITSLAGQTKKKVLVVEDDEVQRRHITELVADKDVTVEAVETATAALDRLEFQTFDCMIMDLSLPDLSGYDLLEKLSESQGKYSYPPVIVYTARDLTREEEERLRQYSGSIIIKGAKSPERLLNEVTLFLHRVESDLPPERQKMLRELRSREKGLEGRTILAVDDDVRNIFALTSVLEQYGATVVVARNGKEALTQLAEIPDIDLVLMDIMMPEMDGFEAMQRIRAQRQFEKLPIIALTAKTMKDDQVKCLSHGANDYLAKPLNVDKLLSLIRVWLPQQRSFRH